MSSPSSQLFECQWRSSGRLLALYLSMQSLALVTLLTSPIPSHLCVLGLLLLLVHAAWTIPSRILLLHRCSWHGLRQEPQGWSLWSRSGGWQSIQLQPDSMALTSMVVLRFKLPGQWFARSLCIMSGTMSAEQHRRLRLRLKFSRRRWAAAE